MNAGDPLFHRLAWRIAERLPGTGRGRVVLVTSARPQEGKTWIAEALAAALVEQTGAAVGLLRCSPGVNSGDPENPSVCGLLEGAASAAMPPAGPEPVRVSRFAFGPGPASVLFRFSAMARALDQLRGRFGFVILDGPDLSDCGVLAHCSDGTILVVNAARTRREIVQGSLKAHPIADEKLLGVVLNETPRYVPRWVYRRAL